MRTLRQRRRLTDASFASFITIRYNTSYVLLPLFYSFVWILSIVDVIEILRFEFMVESWAQHIPLRRHLTINRKQSLYATTGSPDITSTPSFFKYIIQQALQVMAVLQIITVVLCSHWFLAAAGRGAVSYYHNNLARVWKKYILKRFRIK